VIPIFADKNSVHLGTWVQINNAEVIEMIGTSDFDFIVIDMEHGNIWLESVEHLIRAAENSNLYPIVRVPENNASLILKVLDLGAKGILVPHISSKEDAEKAVKAAKYSPLGERGSCPCIRAGRHMVENWSSFSRKSNEEVKVILLIEGEEGVANFHEIVTIPGVDAYMIGPFDLSVSLGVPGEVSHPLVEQKFKEVSEIIRKYNKELIGVDFSANESDIIYNLQKWRERGSRIFMTGIDKWIFSKAVKTTSSVINKLRGEIKA
jgi:4-hydroxy-2-oxoheptanedioate aldolase